MFSKKAISPVIAWVLLVGFSVALASIVGSWYLSQSQEMTEEALTTLEGGIECNDVNINVAYTKDQNGDCMIKVSNTGSFKINMVRINDIQKGYNKNPKEYKNYTDAELCTKPQITVIPILEKDKKLTSCQNDRTYEQKIL